MIKIAVISVGSMSIFCKVFAKILPFVSPNPVSITEYLLLALFLIKKTLIDASKSSAFGERASLLIDVKSFLGKRRSFSCIGITVISSYLY